MSEAVIADRKATLGEVRDHAEAIRGKAQVLGLDPPTVPDDGTVVGPQRRAGYGAANRLSVAVSGIVGAYVQAIT